MSISGDPLNLTPGFIKFQPLITQRKVIREFNSDFYSGDLHTLLDSDGSALAAVIDKSLDKQRRLHSYILFNTNKDISDDCRTFVKGQVINQPTGVGVSGVSVIVAGTNRFELSEGDGLFKTLVYGDAFKNRNDRKDNVIISYAGLCQIDVIDKSRGIDPVFAEPNFDDTLIGKASPFSSNIKRILSPTSGVNPTWAPLFWFINLVKLRSIYISLALPAANVVMVSASTR